MALVRIIACHEHLKNPSNFEFFQILYVEPLELLAEPLGFAEHTHCSVCSTYLTGNWQPQQHQLEHLWRQRLLQDLQELIWLTANCNGITEMLNTRFDVTLKK